MMKKIILGLTMSLVFSSTVQAIQNPVMRLAEAMCNKLSECNPSLDENICLIGVLNSESVANDFGVPVPDTSGVPFSQTSNEIITGYLSVNIFALNACFKMFDAADCSVDFVVGAWEESDPENFDNIENIVEGPCEDIFY